MGDLLATAAQAAAIVNDGGIIVLPTETVYGFAARPDDAGVARIFEVKERPQMKTLQLLIPDASWLDRLAEASEDASALAREFWPGPLTLVVAASRDAPGAVMRDGTIGLRVPAHPIALDVLALTGPLAASSANRSGEPTPPTVGEIRAIFGDRVDGYLDGEYIDALGSTVVAVSDGRVCLLRAGVLAAEAIGPVVGGRFEGD